MTDGEIINDVTIAGVLVARPAFKPHPSRDSQATFSVESGNNIISCVAFGRVAGNLLRFGAAGCEILGQGRLTWPSDSGPPHVVVERLGFTNPREVAERFRWFDRPRKVKA